MRMGRVWFRSLVFFSNNLYSLKSEKGGLVTTISACCKSAILSALLKSPSPLSYWTPISSMSGVLLLFFVTVVFQINGSFRIVLAKQIAVLVLVTGGNEFF